MESYNPRNDPKHIVLLYTAMCTNEAHSSLMCESPYAIKLYILELGFQIQISNNSRAKPKTKMKKDAWVEENNRVSLFWQREKESTIQYCV